MGRLSVLCFAGTYGLALICDLARFVVRAPVRWHVTVGLTALGWVVQTAFLMPAVDLGKLEYVLVITNYRGGLTGPGSSPPCTPTGGTLPAGEQPCALPTPAPSRSTPAPSRATTRP